MPLKISKGRGWRLGAGYGATQFVQPIIMAIVFYTGIQFNKIEGFHIAFSDIVQVFFAFQFSSFSLVNIVTLLSDLETIKGVNFFPYFFYPKINFISYYYYLLFIVLIILSKDLCVQYLQ